MNKQSIKQSSMSTYW